MRKHKMSNDRKKARNLMVRKKAPNRPDSMKTGIKDTKNSKIAKKYPNNKPIQKLQKPTKPIKGKSIKHKQGYKNQSSDSNSDSDMDMDDNSDSDLNDSSENKQISTAGLANVISSILAKKTDKKVILIKSKTDKEITINKLKQQKKDEDKGEDCEAEDGTVVFEKTKEKNSVEVNSDDEDLLQDRELKREKRIKKKTWEDMARSKPNVEEDKDNEDFLKKIALRGVLQLFNAVHKQQRKIKETVETAGTSERKRDKAMKSISKGEFMDMLKGTTVNVADKPKAVKTEEKSKTKSSEVKKSKVCEKPSWNVLQQDFMMGAKMKDWDRESDSEDEMDIGQADGSDSDRT